MLTRCSIDALEGHLVIALGNLEIRLCANCIERLVLEMGPKPIEQKEEVLV